MNSGRIKRGSGRIEEEMTHGTEKDNILKVHGGPLRPEVGSTSTRSGFHFDPKCLAVLKWQFVGFDEFWGFSWIFHGLGIPKLGSKVPKHG